MHSLSLSLPLGERHTPRNVDAFFLKIDCWDQAVLLVCAWEKEDLPERRPKMKEMVSRMREHLSVTQKEEWWNPHVSDAHLRLDSPSLVLSNQILNDLQKRNAIMKPITRWQTKQQPSIHRQICSRADAGMLNNK